MLSFKKIKTTAVALVAAMGISLGASNVASANQLDLHVDNSILGSDKVVNYYYDDDYYYGRNYRRHHRHHDDISDEEAALLLTVLAAAAIAADNSDRDGYNSYYDDYRY